MTLTRRDFLRGSGVAAAYLLFPGWLSACSQLTSHAAAPLASPAVWGAGTPTADPALIHLLSRITYGPRPGDPDRIAKLGWDAFIEQQLHPEQIDDSALEQRLKDFPTLQMTSAELLDAYPPKVPGPQTIIQELESAALLRAAFSERQLLELMVDVWSSHFNIYIRKDREPWLKPVDDREVIRKHALGRFSDLLLASAKSPAMLVYLDNIDNVAPRPADVAKRHGYNENYAREVMELHTVGVDGGYTQDDVHTVARIFTGWSVGQAGSAAPGEFLFRPGLHDSGAKRIAFLNLDLPAGGGVADGEALLAKLAAHPQTAARVARLLCAAFVADDPPAALVSRAAQAYLDSGTDIRATLAAILHSAEFKDAAAQKIKLPLRVVVSAIRALGVDLQEPPPTLAILRGLGQAFFAWPSPDGYPRTGAAWINANGMIGRWNLAFALAQGRVRGAHPDLSWLTSADRANPATLVDSLSAGLLHQQLPDALREPLLTYAGGKASAQLAPALAGLMLASPAFQIY